MYKDIYIYDIDIENNIAFGDDGIMYDIEDYVDEQEEPCYHEEARYAFVRTNNNSYQRIDLLEEE